MSRRSTKLTAIILTAILLSLPSPASAQSRGSSKAKRITWAIVGTAAGFGLGAWFGLHRFDDATNSDRKVWISAISGAVMGGIAGGVLSRDAKPSFVPQGRVPSGRSAHKVRIANPIRSGPPVFFEVH